MNKLNEKVQKLEETMLSSQEEIKKNMRDQEVAMKRMETEIKTEL